MHDTSISAEPWQFAEGRKRTIRLPDRRAEIERKRQLEAFITAHRFGRIQGFTRLRTPDELAKLSRETGQGFRPMEIEYAAARAGIAVGEPPKY